MTLPLKNAGALVALLALPMASAALVWDDGGDNVSVFSEANWTDNSGVAGTDPPANSVNGASDVLFDCIIGNDTRAGGAGGAGNHFDLGSGYSLTIADDASWLSNLGGGYGIRGVSGGGTENLILATSGTITTTFLLDLSVSMSNRATLALHGGGSPVNATAIDLAAGWTGALRFAAETVSDVQAEHLSKITVNGSPALDGGAGQNVALVGDGGAGSILTRYVAPVDTDMDGMRDDWETTYFGNLSRDGTGDFDGDGLSDLAEFTLGTFPDDTDSDHDLLGDGIEGPAHGTDPANADSDHDGNPDGFEIAKGLDPLDDTSRVERPNIIFILADDMGYGDLGVLWQNGRGGMKHATPHLDTMASQGMILDRHYTPAPVCAPCRGSLITGLHQGHATINDTNFDEALPDNHTFATTLRSAGYATGMIGKYGVQGGGGTAAAWPAYPTKRGFDFYHGYVRHADGHQHYPANSWAPGNSTAHRSPKELWENDSEISGSLDKCFTPDLFTARAKSWINDQVTDNPRKPFFLYLAYDTPHAALQLATQAYPAGSGFTGGVRWNGIGGGPAINTATGTIDSYYHPDYASKAGWSDAEKRFASLMRRMDNNLGDLLQTLRDLGIHDNTLVVWSSDNGPHEETYLSGNGGGYNASSFDSFGPFEGIKRDCWEGGVRMPTIAWWPNTISAGTVDTTPSQMHDWHATFADLAMVPRPAYNDGVSLRPVLTGNGTQREPTVYIEFNHGGSAPNYPEFDKHGGASRAQAQVIHLEGYKGIRNNVQSHADDFAIYDIDTDLEEANNLAATNAYFDGLQQRMKDRVLRLRNNRGTASRPWSGELVRPMTPAVRPGVLVKTFEGLWPYVPEFSHMPPIATTEALVIDPASQLSRSTEAGVLYTGFINIPAGGTWNFHLTSDSGAHLRIHDSHVVDDDFQHDGSESSGSINLAAGLHPFALYYRTRDSLPSLDFQWSGPGTPKAPVPATALFAEGTPDPEPVAVDDSAGTTRDAAVSINVLVNDVDDGAPSPLSISDVSRPGAGTATASGGRIIYDPDPEFLGTDRFRYTITDGQFTATATVTVSVVHETADLWIPCNACGGTAVHDAGGILLGTMSGSASRVGGPPDAGMAMSFDGSDSEFALPGSPAMPGGGAPRSAMCWIRVPTGESLENQTMFGYGNNSNGQRFTFRLNGSAGSHNPGTAQQAVRLEVQGGNIIGNTLVDDGAWHHVAVVCDDFDGGGSLNVSETKIYVDGVLDTDPTGHDGVVIAAAAGTDRVMNTMATTPTLGGSNHAGGYSFLGDLDEMRFFPVALTTAEVRAVMAATDPAGAWHRRFFGADTVDWVADADRDGVNRLGEFAFGGQPWLNDAGSLQPGVLLNPATGKLEINFTRRIAGSHGITYTVQASHDLQHWVTLDATEIGRAALSAAECLETATFETDATVTDEPVQFSRVVVSSP
jgi:arylsulfatase A-like enzyme